MNSADACPCYKCFFITSLKARRCNPAECDDLTEWINILVQPRVISRRLESVVCVWCGSSRTVKAGFSNKARRYGGHQLYKCKNCKKRFRPGFYFKKKNRKDVIDYARKLADQDQPAFSTRDISQKIQLKFEIYVSHTTVAEWIKE